MTCTIPKIIHQIWLGPMPHQISVWMNSWKINHPDWEHRLWTDKDIPSLDCKKFSCDSPARMADLMRYEILATHGGAYLDSDMIFVRSLDLLGPDPWLCSGFEGFETKIGAMATHANNDLFTEATKRATNEGDILESSGPRFFKNLIEEVGFCGHRDLEYTSFYPISFYDRHIIGQPGWKELIPHNTIGVHAWNGSWL